MEIKVGIQHVNREIVVDTNDSAAEVQQAFADAMATDGLLTLNDSRGRKVLVVARTISYLDIGEENARRVGFGAL